MAYTGTGTEQNPYLVSTLSDFLTCAAAADAYVKVISDIDAADDPEYTGVITDAVAVNCRKLYADYYDDRKIAISGIVVQNDKFLSLRPGTVDIQNLCFRDCKHKKTGNTTPGYLIYSAGTNAATANHHIENCDFSVQSSGGSGVTYHVFYGDSTYVADVRFAQYCGFDISCGFTSLTYLYIGNIFRNIEECNFVFRNPVWAAPASNTRNKYFTAKANFTSCAIVLKNPVFLGSTNTAYIYCGDVNGYSWDYCYISLINPTGTATLKRNSEALQSYFILENAPDTINANGVVSALLTPEQLRDRDYLISIGFLP